MAYFIVPSAPKSVASKLTVRAKDQQRPVSISATGDAYIFDTEALFPNPSFTLSVGTTYVFAVNASGNPLTIMMNSTPNGITSIHLLRMFSRKFFMIFLLDIPVALVINNGIENGTMTFTPTKDMEGTSLYYVCSVRLSCNGFLPLQILILFAYRTTRACEATF